MNGKNSDTIKLATIPWKIKDLQALPLDGGQVAIWWLGQAGFAVRTGLHTFLIDPYLSDSLARKYRGQKFAHRRMMPVPVDPAALKGIDWVFCTHRHTDHMDPDTLRPLARNPQCRFFVPCAVLDQAVATQGLDAAKTACVNAGQPLNLDTGISLQPIPAAHEQITVNAKGEHHFLGYIVGIGDIRIYHSGDCAPYDGLAERLQKFKPDVALLPVNGRDDYRLSHHIPGNFHFEEAQQLCLDCDIPYLVVHHFGMFDFNTVDPLELRTKIDNICGPIRIILPDIDIAYCLEK